MVLGPTHLQSYIFLVGYIGAMIWDSQIKHSPANTRYTRIHGVHNISFDIFWHVRDRGFKIVNAHGHTWQLFWGLDWFGMVWKDMKITHYGDQWGEVAVLLHSGNILKTTTSTKLHFIVV